jgi:hypothetical protein
LAAPTILCLLNGTEPSMGISFSLIVMSPNGLR